MDIAKLSQTSKVQAQVSHELGTAQLSSAYSYTNRKQFVGTGNFIDEWFGPFQPKDKLLHNFTVPLSQKLFTCHLHDLITFKMALALIL